MCNSLQNNAVKQQQEYSNIDHEMIKNILLGKEDIRCGNVVEYEKKLFGKKIN